MSLESQSETYRLIQADLEKNHFLIESDSEKDYNPYAKLSLTIVTGSTVVDVPLRLIQNSNVKVVVTNEVIEVYPGANLDPLKITVNRVQRTLVRD